MSRAISPVAPPPAVFACWTATTSSEMFGWRNSSVVQPNALKGAERELNQLEVYRADLRALDSYPRRVRTVRQRSAGSTRSANRRVCLTIASWRAPWGVGTGEPPSR